MGQSPKRCKEKGLPSRTLCAGVLACPILPVPARPCPPPPAPESLNDSQGVNSPLRGAAPPGITPFTLNKQEEGCPLGKWVRKGNPRG